ncbi:hypothetical protein ACFHW2_32220 [Actinomadura sp. LOL_016]|uniref:hypothetical protein n=1 Tax=unclassified Actinomadura TaxID=2626254 RepID=UPI003A80CA38
MFGMRGRCVLWILVLLLSFGAVSCKGDHWTEVIDEGASERLAERMSQVRSSRCVPGVLLRDLTDFRWDKVYFFGAGTHVGRDVRAKTGFTFMPDDAYLLGNEKLIVFVRDSRLAKVVFMQATSKPRLTFQSGARFSTDVRILYKGEGRSFDVVETADCRGSSAS